MGIGAAIAEQLARDGMTVLVSDINFRAESSPAKCAGCVWNLSSVSCSSMKRFLL
jgi:NAD(P)-dependent dehydrogenase (short-subunit alcohol dehydrogenase family)